MTSTKDTQDTAERYQDCPSRPTEAAGTGVLVRSREIFGCSDCVEGNQGLVGVDGRCGVWSVGDLSLLSVPSRRGQ